MRCTGHLPAISISLSASAASTPPSTLIVRSGAATLGGMQAIAQTGPCKTLVLIHGAYHGGWCWRKVVDILDIVGRLEITQLGLVTQRVVK